MSRATLENELLVRECFISLNCLLDRLRELRQSKYPSKSIEPFFWFLDVLFSRLKTSLEQIEKDLKTGNVFQNTIRFFWSFLKSDMAEYLNNIQSSNSTQVPHELIRSLEELVHAVSPGVCLLFRPFEDHNYAHMDILAQLTGKLDVYLEEFYEGTQFDNLIDEFSVFVKSREDEVSEILKEGFINRDDNSTPWISKLSLIAFPSLERKAFAQHCLVGHEIGHLVAEESVDRITRNIKLDETVRSKLEEILKAESPEILKDAEKFESLVDDCLVYAKRYFIEIFCDFVECMIFGWPALLAEYHFHLGRDNLDKPGKQHPPDRYRMLLMTKYVGLKKLRESLKTRDDQRFKPLIRKIDDLTTFAEDQKRVEQLRADNIIQRVVLKSIDENIQYIEEDVNKAFEGLSLKGADIDFEIVIPLYDRLCQHVTPNLIYEVFDSDKLKNVSQAVEFRHIMAAAWLYKICDLDEMKDRGEDEKNSILADRLSLRATEVNFVHRNHIDFTHKEIIEGGKSDKDVGIHLDPRLLEDPDTKGSVLCASEILSALQNKEPELRLHITPLFRLDQISDGAVDVRLGNEFITFRRTEFPALDVKDPPDLIERRLGQYHSRYKIDFGAPFVLHPNELVLGSTLEYISLPTNVFSFVLSRSSWGRLGLLIATATAVNPGYQGCLTLELVNLGEVPLVLYPGLPVAQLILMNASSGKYSGHYQGPTGPEFSNVHTKTIENDFWTRPFGR